MSEMKPLPRWSFPAKTFLVCVLACSLATPAAFGLIGTAYQMQLGNPSDAGADPTNHQHFLLQRAVEAIDYSDLLGVPNWVSWDLTVEDIGDASRSDSFYTDPDLPSTFYRVTDADYSNSGYTRGHMCPSMDRTDTAANNHLVFYMSNIIPQTVDNNGGVWSGLEIYCQTLAKAGNELLILCGPRGFDGSRIQPSGKAAIPAYTWKIVLVVPSGSGLAVNRITTSTRVIAVDIPNITGIAGTPWTSYLTSVNQLQTNTGFTFFTALPPRVATVLRALIDGTPAPALTTLSPIQGAVGTTVVITGTNLAGASIVDFNGIPAPFTLDSTTQLTVSVPTGATTGPITVVTPGGAATSLTSFGVTGSDQVGILVQPVSQVADAGSDVLFSVEAIGANLGYQWWRDGSVVSDAGNALGATSNRLHLAAIGSADAGHFSVVVSNYTGAVTSRVASLTISADTNTAPPTILTQPSSLSVVAGQDATFRVAATGAGPLVYCWRFNGENLTGATQITYTRANAQAAEAGAYSVVITNRYGSITSTEARLTIQNAGAAGVIAQWNFNNTNTLVISPLPTTGTGTASLVGGATAAYATGSASDTNVGNNAWNTTTYPAQGTGNKTRGVQFKVSTRGYRDLVVSWDQKLSNTASKYYRLQYSSNGIDFIDGPVVLMTASGSFESKTNLLAGLPGTDDNPDFAFRVVAEFASTATLTTNANYATASTSSYGTGGTVRYDMITISGSPLASSSTLGVLSHGPGWVQLGASGAGGYRHVLEYSGDLTTWNPLYTNTLPFDYVDSTPGSANARFYRTVQAP